MQKTLLTTALLAGTALAAPAFAQDDALALDEIVIYYGALAPRSDATTGQAVTVISRADLVKTGETRLTEVLARLPGVGIVARGPMGAQTGFTLRGLSQNYVKVLVDGIDVADPSGTQVAYDFGRLNAQAFGRAELMRGSQSAVHGGQAVAGVLSLETPRPEAEGVTQQVALELGAYDTLAAAYSYGVKRGDNEFAFQLSHLKSDGFSAADENDGNTEADGYEAQRLSARGQMTLDNGVVLGFSGFAENTSGEFDETAFDPVTFASYPVDGTPDERTDARSRGARVFAQFDTGALAHELSLSAFKIYRHTEGSDSFGPTYFNYDGKRRAASWKAATDLGAGRLTFGLDRTLEDFAQASTYGGAQGKTGVTGAFGEFAFSPAAGVDVVASVRRDAHSAYGGFTTARLGATWALREDLILRSSLGTGYRAPSGYELYGPYGDATLQPEQSRSLDLGVEKRLGQHSLRATLFRVETDDLIDYAWPSYYQTSGQATRQGLELEAAGRLGARIGYSVSYTYLDAENPAGLSAGSTWNSSFGRHTIAATLDAELAPRLTGAISLRHVADRQTLPDYTVVNAQLSYELDEGKSAYLRVENLFDEQYQLWPDYGTSDRALSVGLRATF